MTLYLKSCQPLSKSLLYSLPLTSNSPLLPFPATQHHHLTQTLTSKNGNLCQSIDTKKLFYVNPLT